MWFENPSVLTLICFNAQVLDNLESYFYTATYSSFSFSEYSSCWELPASRAACQRSLTACCSALSTQQPCHDTSCCASLGRGTWGALWVSACSSVDTKWSTAAADPAVVAPCLQELRYLYNLLPKKKKKNSNKWVFLICCVVKAENVVVYGKKWL